MEIVALIGVRGGSKRVKNKNSRPFAGSNLLELKIATLRRVPGIARVIVNSECDHLLDIARSSGAETIKRDPQFANDHITSSDYYQHVAENCPAEIILSASVTTPLFTVESYQKGIEAFRRADYAKHDSVTSCCRIKEFLYRDGVALNYDPQNQVRSQDLPRIMAVNYGFSIIRRDDMIKLRNIVGKRPLMIETSRLESIDIDTQEDFFIASTLYNALQAEKREAA
ncbi:CMP-N,N'-diacetyllegionaminic acid synthase [Stieleria maiorica]|uniref:CMP-N,N'-diacetyllegionaminic acid synthase n=1 Tax=Stieleria maiorica TaxID=2795974 RepID=A0A5B9MT37_9BACT|nr:acylneuraminate cytidylyltransferase family protein [Stieleria maiorica]QEG02208.1 CMP-N,N'-diacetyllegionaminic acid synthase [Stieleria maiorica]